MNTIRKNSQGYGYKYTDLAEIHRHMEEVGHSYFQEIETVGDEDYVITHVLDATGKELRKCRGCRVVKTSGKNPAQDYGSALTYSRRYSLLMAFGLATTDDDAAALTPQKTRTTKPKATDKALSRTTENDCQWLRNEIIELQRQGRFTVEQINEAKRVAGCNTIPLRELEHHYLVSVAKTLGMRI
jgi:hypothetical protein